MTEHGDVPERNFPRAQSRPEDTAGARQQRRMAWIVAIGILIIFLMVSSSFIR